MPSEAVRGEAEKVAEEHTANIEVDNQSPEAQPADVELPPDKNGKTG